MKKPEGYYWGDFFTKIGAGFLSGGLVAVNVTNVIKEIPPTAIVIALICLYFGYKAMIDNDR